MNMQDREPPRVSGTAGEAIPQGAAVYCEPGSLLWKRCAGEAALRKADGVAATAADEGGTVEVLVPDAPIRRREASCWKARDEAANDQS